MLEATSEELSNVELDSPSKLDKSSPSPPTTEAIAAVESPQIGHQEFINLVSSCQQAIDLHGIRPIRASEGSSGSYFVKDDTARIVGVFKPKDEEPYGQFNPRWIKWLHRTCCPCLFGRSFLMPNTGYLSEAAASTLDDWLGLNMVPRTQIVHLRSDSFYWPWWERYRIWRARHQEPSTPYPLKMGSFQLFVEGFEESSTVISRLESLRPWEPELHRAFQREFERMTILDYAMRNTDRTMANWLIHLSWVENENYIFPETQKMGGVMTGIFTAVPSTHELSNDSISRRAVSEENLPTSRKFVRLMPQVKIACIDNGLAFPFRHPSEVRSYPYSWIGLPEARIPYSTELRQSLIAKLGDMTRWEDLVDRLRIIFSIDSDFNERIFRKQMAIVRGQLWNIVEALKEGESPLQLIGRPLLAIEEDLSVVEARTAASRYRKRPIHVDPLCSCW